MILISDDLSNSGESSESFDRSYSPFGGGRPGSPDWWYKSWTADDSSPDTPLAPCLLGYCAVDGDTFLEIHADLLDFVDTFGLLRLSEIDSVYAELTECRRLECKAAAALCRRLQSLLATPRTIPVVLRIVDILIQQDWLT